MIVIKDTSWKKTIRDTYIKQAIEKNDIKMLKDSILEICDEAGLVEFKKKIEKYPTEEDDYDYEMEGEVNSCTQKCRMKEEWNALLSELYDVLDRMGIFIDMNEECRYDDSKIRFGEECEDALAFAEPNAKQTHTVAEPTVGDSVDNSRSDLTNIRVLKRRTYKDFDKGGEEHTMYLVEYTPRGAIEDGRDTRLFGCVTDYDGSDEWTGGAIVDVSKESALETFKRQIELLEKGWKKYSAKDSNLSGKVLEVGDKVKLDESKFDNDSIDEELMNDTFTVEGFMQKKKMVKKDPSEDNVDIRENVSVVVKSNKTGRTHRYKRYQLKAKDSIAPRFSTEYKLELRKIYKDLQYILMEGENADLKDNVKKAFDYVGGNVKVSVRDARTISYDGDVNGYTVKGTIYLNDLGSSVNLLSADLLQAYNRTHEDLEYNTYDLISYINLNDSIKKTTEVNDMKKYKIGDSVKIKNGGNAIVTHFKDGYIFMTDSKGNKYKCKDYYFYGNEESDDDYECEELYGFEVYLEGNGFHVDDDTDLYDTEEEAREAAYEYIEDKLDDWGNTDYTVEDFDIKIYKTESCN